MKTPALFFCLATFLLDAYEYEADLWSYEVLYRFGYISEEQLLKLKELSQLQTLVWTKQLTREAYDKIVSLPQFQNYDRSKGLFSDKIAESILNGVIEADILKALKEGREHGEK